MSTQSLFTAAKSGNISGIQAAIKSGTNPNVTNEIGGTPLHYAVISGQPAAVGALLACGAEPGKGDETLCTPLHLAAMMGNISIIKKLLEAGAAPNVRDSNGVCPLHGAAMKGCTGAVDVLLTGGADPSITDLDGYTPLHLARKYDHKDTQKRLERVEKPALTKTQTKTRDRDGYVCCQHCGERALANWTCPVCGNLFCIACSGSGSRKMKDLGGAPVEEYTIGKGKNTCPVCTKPSPKWWQFWR